MARAGIPVVLAMVAATGCAARPHVELPAPPPRSAPTSERVAAYVRHHPEVFTVVPRRRGGARVVTSVILGGRERVFHPEDLAALVDPASTTAVAGRRAAATRVSADRWLVTGWSMIALGTAVMVTSLQVNRDRPTSGPLLLPGIALILGGTGGLALASRRRRDAILVRSAAFSSYDQDLLRHLGLCVDGLRVVDCVGSAPPPPR